MNTEQTSGNIFYVYLNLMIEIFQFLKFYEFINELGKTCFLIGKTEF